ncbi:energy-coupling factor ABC transporter permease [Amphritea sp. 1_MG-2023]|uniref:energy-coupling factor ABC transporter permease n=1 Tax=Amphritea sp. 1_MG-2023 TaxID=3062670 RepID=UPI0026E306CC|nr:energy-coupling factor ABC transporter permease [Amphritea sp. 1_MG-2023]MDO6565361.1 energy-coupling factor ABC transporter permease [Amphritea sp. 1_MG-2023]
MNLTSDLITGFWFWVAQISYFVLLATAIWSAPWSTLFNNRQLQHLFLGTTAGLVVLWQMRAGITPGLGIHFLGVTVLTLMFGWNLAILSASMALLGTTLIGQESWHGFAINGLCTIVIPVLISYLILRLVEAKLPANFFIYLFLCAFLGAAAATLAGGLSMSFLLWIDNVYSGEKIYREYIQILPLIAFPEGLLNGIIMTGMMVFYPDWIRTFDAKKYIDDQ